MKKRLHNKKAGIAILLALILISVAEVIFRAVAMGEAVLTTSNLGEQLAVIALAVTILILTAKGKDRACYICYGAWIAYFVLDQIFELSGVVFGIINQMAQPETIPVAIVIGAIVRVLGMVGIIAIGGLLVEYMSDGTICNKAFNSLCIATVLLLVANIAFSIYGAVVVMPNFALDTFNCLYRLAMVFLFSFFAYDSAKMQLKKINFSK
jgi:hypothetical protein